MCRVGLSWLASLLLLIAQHGALLHELSHHAHGTPSSAATLTGKHQALEDGLCLTCEAFSQVINPATAGAVHIPLCPAAVIPPPDPSYVVVAAYPPTPRSRGPPQV
jgi:hypothetical protein